MSKTFAFLLLPFLLLTQPARGVTPLAPPLALTHVTVIDVSGAVPQPDMTVVFATGRIAAVGKTGHLRVPAHARVIEATGRFLIPGLWDMHAHALDLNGYEWIFPLLVANGVTGIREMGSDLPFDRINEIRQGILDGRIVGPRFGATTGRILDGPGTQLREAWTVATADEARRCADEYKHQGMDFVKPYDLLSRDVYLALVHEAKRQRLAVAGHVPFTMSAAEVSDAGQISIEHNTGIAIACSRDEDALRKELVESSATHFGVLARQPIERKAMMTYDEQKARALFGRFATNGTWMCPTMIMSPVINAQKPESEARMKYRLFAEACG